MMVCMKNLLECNHRYPSEDVVHAVQRSYSLYEKETMVNMSSANGSCIHLPLVLFFVSSVSCFLIASRRSVAVVLAIGDTPLSALKVMNLVSFITVQWSRIVVF